MVRPNLNTLYYQKIEVYNSDRLAPKVSCPLLLAAESGQDDPQYSRCSAIASFLVGWTKQVSGVLVHLSLIHI